MDIRRIVLPGGSGFLGESASKYFKNKGYEIIILTRGKSEEKNNVKYINWDGKNFGEWTEYINGSDAVINFTGKSVNCIYTDKNKKEIIESRTDSVKILNEAIKNSVNPPPVLIQAASLAIYGDTEKTCAEDAPHGEGFSVEVCKLWAAEFFKTDLLNTRKVLLRIGFALGRNGGALVPLTKLTKSFLGGQIASGKQYISWLHIDDLNSMYGFIIENKNVKGIYNATGEIPARNAEFMKTLREVLKMPWSPPVPVFAVKIGARLFMKADSSLALTGRKCIPAKFLNEGFKFKFTDLKKSLVNVLE